MSVQTKLQNHHLSKKELYDKGFQLLGCFKELRNHVEKYNIQNFPFSSYDIENSCDCGKKNIKYKYYATNNFEHSSEYKKENFLLLGSSCVKLFNQQFDNSDGLFDNSDDLFDNEESGDEVEGVFRPIENQISVPQDGPPINLDSGEDFYRKNENQDEDDETILYVPSRKLINSYLYDYAEEVEEDIQNDIESFIDDRSESELTIESEDSILDKL